MENIIQFVSNNYTWFLTITIFLLFALIGYIVDSKREKNDLIKKTEDKYIDADLEKLVVPEDKTLGETINENIKSVTQTVNETPSNESITEEQKN